MRMIILFILIFHINAFATSQIATETTLSGMSAKLPATLGAKTTVNSLSVNVASDQTLPVSGTFWPVTQPVSGTFWQSTQPVSIASMPTTAVTLATAPSTPVTGTFWQSTQPVSLATAPTTPVTGTFWQSTQPVSIASMPSTPVTGTFWQSTQPVSIATAPALVASSAVIGHVIVDTAPSTAVTGPITDTQIRATPLPVSGTVTANATLAAETTKVIGTVNVASAQSIAATQSGTWTVQPGNTANTTAWKVDGSAVTQPVSGTVTANAGSGTLAVSIASLPSGAVTNAGTFAVQSTAVAAVGNPCSNPAATLVSITGATSGTAAVQIVALSGSTKIYICSMTIIGVSGTTPTFSLVQGTGSNCATGQTVVKQSWGTTAGSLYAFANPVAVGVAGNELCYLDTGTTPIQNYQITYVQI